MLRAMKNRRKPLIKMLSKKRKEEQTKRIISEIENATVNLEENQKIINNTLYRREDITRVYNNEQKVCYILKSLVSDLKKNTRL